MGKIVADYHVHCGQYHDIYYEPSTIVKILSKCGIQEAWISSTTSCVSWGNKEEKEYLVRHIEDEIEEACFMASKCKIDLTPLYWVIPQRHFDGESVESIMKNSHYKGFKIHPQNGGWNDEVVSNKLFAEVCEYAEKHNYPILIHTGEDKNVEPSRFEKFFKEFSRVRFVLAHCKEPKKVIGLFKKYDNIYGDTAFCSKKSLMIIQNSGLSKKMQAGTDFPITHWYYHAKEIGIASEEELLRNYRQVIHY